MVEPSSDVSTPGPDVDTKQAIDDAYKNLKNILGDELFMNPLGKLDPKVVDGFVKLARAYIRDGVKLYKDFYAAVKSKIGDKIEQFTHFLKAAWTEATGGGIEVEDRVREDDADATLTDDIFKPYQPSFTIQGAKPHPTALVEAATMAMGSM